MKAKYDFRTFARLLLVLIAVCGICLASAPSASAVQPGVPGMTQQEFAELESDMQVLFTRYIQLNNKDRFEVNTANLTADGQQAQIQGLRRLTDALNTIQRTSPAANKTSVKTSVAIIRRGSTPTIRPANAGDFALCVALEGLGIPAAGAAPGLIAAIKEGIRAWNWGLTAKTVARILGPSTVKALGGPIAIGVSLGWAAWSCRGRL